MIEGSGSGWPKNLWIRIRIRIRKTEIIFKFFSYKRRGCRTHCDKKIRHTNRRKSKSVSFLPSVLRGWFSVFSAAACCYYCPLTWRRSQGPPPSWEPSPPPVLSSHLLSGSTSSHLLHHQGRKCHQIYKKILKEINEYVTKFLKNSKRHRARDPWNDLYPGFTKAMGPNIYEVNLKFYIFVQYRTNKKTMSVPPNVPDPWNFGVDPDPRIHASD